MSRLRGRVAIVTGASRGIGRGVALSLGEAGATVYVTGRSRAASGPTADVLALPGTIDETAALVTERGGRGIAVACDHDDDAQVEALFARVAKDEGQLDVLVNNAFALPAGDVFGKFWDLPLAHWDVYARVGLRSHYVASALAAKAMVPRKKGLIVNVSSFAGGSYAVSVPYGVAKAGVDRMAKDMAIELKKSGVAAVSLWPGVVRTERVLAMGDAWPFDLSKSESPEFTGRAVVALAADEGVLAKTGKVHIVADLAEAYGFTDTDGTRPRAFG